MIWKNKYKKRRRKRSWFNKIKFFNIRTNNKNSYQVLAWIFSVLMIYSIIQYNFFNSTKSKDSRAWNEKQISNLNLSELYKLKDLNHKEVRVWVLNNTNQKGLAAKIRDCLEKGYYIENEHIKGDYNILKQDNFDGRWSDDLKTEIFVHVDTVNNPKFKLHIKEFLLFTGYDNSIVRYRYDKKLYNERDITIKLGEDWDKTGFLPLCGNSIN